MEWGGTSKDSDTIIVLTVSTSGSKESTLYVSTDYGKSFEVIQVTINGDPVVPAYIFQSPTNHKMVRIFDNLIVSPEFITCLS